MTSEEVLKNFVTYAKSGVVTVSNWTISKDGETYLYFYADTWLITTDKMFPISDFHSVEKWQLLAIKEDKVVAIFPGCQVKAFIYCDKSPNVKSVFDFSK